MLSKSWSWSPRPIQTATSPSLQHSFAILNTPETISVTLFGWSSKSAQKSSLQNFHLPGVTQLFSPFSPDTARHSCRCLPFTYLPFTGTRPTRSIARSWASEKPSAFGDNGATFAACAAVMAVSVVAATVSEGQVPVGKGILRFEVQQNYVSHEVLRVLASSCYELWVGIFLPCGYRVCFHGDSYKVSANGLKVWITAQESEVSYLSTSWEHHVFS